VKYLLLVVLVACSSRSGNREQLQPTPVETVPGPANDPWAVRDEQGPAATNLDKLVIGGDNQRPQMGLFALTKADAARVDAEMDHGLEPAYRLAQHLAVKAWAGDRNFCEDAVRQTIGFYGVDGMLDAKELRKWKSATLADIKEQHARAINERHYEMIGEHNEVGCDKTLGIYVEGLQLAATKQLELRNFGF